MTVVSAVTTTRRRMVLVCLCYWFMPALTHATLYSANLTNNINLLVQYSSLLACFMQQSAHIHHSPA